MLYEVTWLAPCPLRLQCSPGMNELKEAGHMALVISLRRDGY